MFKLPVSLVLGMEGTTYKWCALSCHIIKPQGIPCFDIIIAILESFEVACSSILATEESHCFWDLNQMSRAQSSAKCCSYSSDLSERVIL